jgi:flagellum-specific peptidoglycan hydrolase FlgJ
MLQATTLEEQVEALGKSGYATDPEYADKVMAIATSKGLEGL